MLMLQLSDLRCLEYCDQDSPQLVKLVQDHFLKTPPEGVVYNFEQVNITL